MWQTTAFLSFCTLATWTTAAATSPTCHGVTATGIHTELRGSKHIVVSAYREHRQAYGAVRVLAIVDTMDHPAALDCAFCCSDGSGSSRPLEGSVQMHPVHYGYPYVAADIVCHEPPGCNATQVVLSTRRCAAHSAWDAVCDNTAAAPPALTIHNVEQREDFPVFLTVCLSTVSGNYSNTLHFLQTMELYRLWGVQKVVLYLTGVSGAGGFFGQVLDHYAQEGFLEVLPWRLPEGIRENIHLDGQLSVMNECVYRNMYTSRYVLLADVNQLLVPYQHSSLRPLVEELQARHPQASVFRVETHLFSSTRSGGTPKGSMQAHPGQDLMEQVYREPMEEHDFRSHKMVINPRLVVQTAMFEVLKNYGETVDVPSSMCLVMQVKPHEESKEDSNGKSLVLDTRIREFKDLLEPKMYEIVNKMIKARDGIEL